MPVMSDLANMRRSSASLGRSVWYFFQPDVARLPVTGIVTQP
jgi:hypothetical protein